ncbi:MAG: hypothetical protein FJ265_12770 [Planctomycetes bacterium]|nr:hypothetical protein [Planctomycetota bacterium]
MWARTEIRLRIAAVLPARGIVLATAWFGGCNSLPYPPRLVEPPAGRTAVRSLAITVARGEFAVREERPPDGPFGGFCAGTAHGYMVGMDLMPRMADLRAAGMLVFGVLTLPVLVGCTVVDGVSGAFTYLSTAEVAAHLATVERAFAAAPPRFGLDVALPAAAARARPGLALVSPGQPADAALCVRITGAGLLGRCGVDPDVAVVVEVETEWSAGDVHHCAAFQFRSDVAPLTSWTADSARIRAELDLAGALLAERIADELLLVAGSRP